MHRLLTALVAFFTLIQSMDLCAGVHVHAQHLTSESAEISTIAAPTTQKHDASSPTMFVKIDHALDLTGPSANEPTGQISGDNDSANDCGFHLHTCCIAIVGQNMAAIALAPLGENLSTEQLLLLTNFSEIPEKPNWAPEFN